MTTMMLGIKIMKNLTISRLCKCWSGDTWFWQEMLMYNTASQGHLEDTLCTQLHMHPVSRPFFCNAGGYPLKNCSLAPPSPLKCWQLHNLSARVFYLLMMNTLETVFLAAINHPLSLFPTKSFVFHSHFLHTPSPSYQWSLKVHCVPVDGNNDDLGLGQGNSGLHLITFTLYDVFLKWGWW